MYDTLARTQLLQAHMDERRREADAARAGHASEAPRRRLLTTLLTRIRRSAATPGPADSTAVPAVPGQRQALDRPVVHAG